MFYLHGVLGLSVLSHVVVGRRLLPELVPVGHAVETCIEPGPAIQILVWVSFSHVIIINWLIIIMIIVYLVKLSLA